MIPFLCGAMQKSRLHNDCMSDARPLQTYSGISYSLSNQLLFILVTLAVPNSNVTVSYNGSGVQTVELGCEASGYIRPDSDIRWFKEDMELVEGDKYNVSFREGRPNAAQIGLNETSPSRISMLTISGLEMADVGTYSCQSLETGEAASLHLNMEQESGKMQMSLCVVHKHVTPKRKDQLRYFLHAPI